jgi:hypothetical protein
VTTVDRPLALSELLAETVRLYGERIWAAFGIGAVTAGALVLTSWTHPALDLVIAALAFTTTFAAAARLASGDRFTEAWAQVALRLPVLLVLTLVVAVPFALVASQLFLILVAVAWLGVAGFAIPVAMIEREPGTESWFGRLTFALYRSVQLARVEYLHAVGVAAALVLITILLGRVLAAALAGFADNTQDAALVLATVVLSPFLLLGLVVLYFEQRVRAVSSPRPRS